MKNEFYALQAELENGKKLLCWQDKKHFYFALPTSSKKVSVSPPPTLFNTKKEANAAWKNIPSKGGNLKQFANVIEAKKTRIVKVSLSH